jgi:hypothetical protein
MIPSSLALAAVVCWQPWPSPGMGVQMRKRSSFQIDFPDWSEVSQYGVNTLNPGDEFEAHSECVNSWLPVI